MQTGALNAALAEGARVARVSAQFPRPIVLKEVAAERAEAAVRVRFEALYRDYKRKVYATVQHVVGPSDETDDVVQNAFLEIYRSLPKYQGNSQLSTWIYRITVNVALQHIRKRRRRRVFLFFGDDEREMETQGHDLRPRYEQRDMLVKLYALLEKISEKKRIVFVLHEIDGMAIEDVAEVCDAPLNTVRSRLHAARTELTERMRKAGMLE